MYQQLRFYAQHTRNTLSKILSRRFHRAILGALFLLSTFAILTLALDAPPDWVGFWPPPHHPGITNSTLGFSAILALTPTPALPRMPWRLRGLRAAARLTQLHITYPRQPAWPPSTIAALQRNNPANTLSPGSARCWLGHLEMLRHAARLGSALIIEDDADWDVTLRAQIAPIAAALRDATRPRAGEGNGTGGAEGGGEAGGVAAADGDGDGGKFPYGDAWDVLFLGHCGASILAGTYTAFRDATIPPANVSSWEPRVAHNPGQMRYVHEARNPLCTYAYAVTGEAARAILADETHGSAEGVDVWYMGMCGQGKLRCWAVSPEVVHEHVMGGVRDSVVNGQWGGEEGVERTENIWHSARCNAGRRAGEELVSCMG